eukprot:Gb_16844 [translate_table: standard]
MLAILHAIRKWRQYLVGVHFKVKTNHDSLKYFLNQRVSSMEQQKWVSKMQGFYFKIMHKKSKENVIVDALSRKDEEASLFIVSKVAPTWMEELREEWDKDQEVKERI